MQSAIRILSLLAGALVLPSAAGELRFGTATIDITPTLPAALDGQRQVRIATRAETPLHASVLALEAGEGLDDQAILVSCDLVAIRQGILDKVRAKLAPLLPGFDVRKLVLSATHTHTAPVTLDGKYDLPAEGVLQPSDYAEWLTQRLAEGAAKAWRGLRPGRVGWGQSQAVVAQNRRATYADGTAAMYGPTNVPHFRGIEGYEDHDVDVLCFWDMNDRLVATAINIACPSQEVGGQSVVHADFWHPVREQLRARHGRDLTVLTWTGAGGDQVPNLMYGKASDARMRRLRGDLSRLDEIARRVVLAWEDAHAAAAQEKHAAVPFAHHVGTLQLPWRKVTILERSAAMQEAAKYADNPKQRWNYLWNQRVVDRFNAQKAGDAGAYEMELHAIRLGDVALATNDFELFTDYGIQIKGRSPALQTFILQLSGPGTYLPTARAVAGGGYSAVIQSCQVGPEGGQVLVNGTVDALRALWPAP